MNKEQQRAYGFIPVRVQTFGVGKGSRRAVYVNLSARCPVCHRVLRLTTRVTYSSSGQMALRGSVMGHMRELHSAWIARRQAQEVA